MMNGDTPRASGKVSFLDFCFSDAGADATLDAVAARASLDLPFVYVSTPNVDHVVGVAREPARRPLYDGAWMLLNDSRILSRLAKLVELSLPVVTGADLAERLFDEVIHRHEPVAIVGGEEDMIAALQRRYGLTDVRWHQAPTRLKHNPEAVVAAAAFAAAQRARFTFICVGAPQQELVAYAMQQRGDASGIGLCVGAALDFLAGKRRRSPSWMRAAGLEWLYRLLQEPARLWRRYLVDGPQVFALFAAWRSAMVAANAA